MEDGQNEVADKDIHPEARRYIRKIVNEYAQRLILQSKIEAKKDSIVLKSHAEQAEEKLNDNRRKAVLYEVLILVGGLLFGTAFQGLINEFQPSLLRPFWLVFYIIMLSIGIIIVGIGFFLQYVK